MECKKKSGCYESNHLPYGTWFKHKNGWQGITAIRPVTNDNVSYNCILIWDNLDYVSVMDWRAVQVVPCFSLSGSWERLQPYIGLNGLSRCRKWLDGLIIVSFILLYESRCLKQTDISRFHSSIFFSFSVFIYNTCQLFLMTVVWIS